MRLLFVTQDFPPDLGGIQTYSWEVAPRLAERCEQFLLIAPARPGDEDIDASLDFPVHRLSVRPDLLVLRAAPHILRLSRRYHFDAVVHVQWQTAFASLLARRLTASPAQIAVTLHGKDTVFNPFNVSILERGYNALRRTAIGAADHVLPVSRFLARRAQQLSATEDQITVIPNATNPDVFYPDPDSALREEWNAEDRPIVVSAGRLVPKKGFDTAIRTISRVADEIPDVLLLIAGDGPEASSLKQLARDLQAEEHVHFLGRVPQDQLRRYYSLADVFMMVGRREPGDIEGFGLVYLEANACGTPTLGARVGGVPDAIQDEQTGLLVPPEDPAAAAHALTRLLTNPELARRLGEQGRERVLMEANWDHVAERIYALLAQKAEQ